MTFDRYSQRRRTARNRLLLIAALVAAAGLGAGLFALLTGGSDSRKPEAQRPKHTSALPTRGSSEPTVLPKPRGIRDGVPVGYPHTTDGAVSAAAHFFDVLDLFTPDAAEEQATVMAKPGNREALGTKMYFLARGIREDAKLPGEGEASDANYFTSSSRAYRVAKANSDEVSVWLLTDDTVSVRGVVRESTQVQGAVMVWAEGDWRLTEKVPQGEEPDVATPDSPEAAQAGWRSLAFPK